MERYVAATSKLQKMSIISEIVTKVRIASPDGGFVKLKESGWYEGMFFIGLISKLDMDKNKTEISLSFSFYI